MSRLRTLVASCFAAGLAALLAACTAPAPSIGGVELEAPSQGPVFSRHAVAAAHPLAVEAGLQMLRRGGSAVDAAVAVQLVLSLVEPQSSGIGGGAFMLLWDGSRLHALDGRETAPAAADERLFLRDDGQPMPFAKAVVGGRAVGVPGTVALLAHAHARHGQLPWAALFEPAIGWAEQGFELSPRLHAQLAADAALKTQPAARAFFYREDGSPHPVGHRLRNPALAAVLRQIAQRGPQAFYGGAVAEDLVRRVREHANPGRITLADLQAYAVKEREGLCSAWRGFRVCGMPPPSSGHLAVMQILGIGEFLGWEAPSDLANPPSLDLLHKYTEAARLAYADRALYVADPDFVSAPGGRWTSLLDPDYLKSRATTVGARSMRSATAGQPAGSGGRAWAPQASAPEFGTSHISIVDGQGRALAMTTTIEAVWGSRLLADGGTGLPGGYLLNNELTDFSFAPTDAQGRTVANRVEPGKRPRSSMSPTLVFDAKSRVLMSLGSPGGAQIIHYTTRTLLGTLAFGQPLQRVIAGPNFGSLNGPTQLERGRFEAATLGALRERGHEVVEIEMGSGIHALIRTRQGWVGGADPRREGVVRGD